jgi:hypothetical protein
MKTVRVVVITWTFGGGDNLYQPIGFVNATLSKVKYVDFWDKVTRQKQEDNMGVTDIIPKTSIVGSIHRPQRGWWTSRTPLIVV